MALLSMADLLETNPDVRKIAAAVARFLKIGADRLVIGDADHECLSDGAYSIAYEGAYEWPYRFTTAVESGEATVPGGWFLSVGTGWFLACYPDA